MSRDRCPESRPTSRFRPDRISRYAATGMPCINIPHGTVRHSLIRKARQVPALTARRCVSMAGAATDMPSTSAAGLAQKIVPATIDDLESIAHNNVVMAKV